MRLTHRIATMTAAIALFGVIGVPAAASAATTSTGTVTVMLMTTSKQELAMAGASVVMTNEKGVVRSGRTASNGQVTLYDAPAGDHWMIRAVAPAGAGIWTRLPGVRWGVPVTAGKHSWVVVVMRLGGSIGGTVRDNAGNPVPGALVVATGSDVKMTVTTHADAQGRYSVNGLPLSDFLVEYSRAPGYPVTGWWWSVRAQYGDKPRTLITNADVVVDDLFEMVGVVWTLSRPTDPTFVAAPVSIVNTTTGAVISTTMDGSEFHQQLTAGTYKVSVTGRAADGHPVTYWQTGEDTRPSTDPSKAVTVTFTGLERKVIYFNLMI
ncbi:carboxypeptidase-like regulatory domain-containing protein [Glaciihabitans sp. dw_435]|uniref:carboxypeptidase-like regulatory domain-containing protein n=1 Tax=Glaciihabitans sp. dw_435 TaxID=2720081 RepID=UPI001BD69590|nr:carboxypeptidase-like regulatory domain-containing protein [Glaciihabitans sp. dw_435]